MKCPCPSCKKGKTDEVHLNPNLISRASVVQKTVNWECFPKLAEIFRHRPVVNLYWQELMEFTDYIRQNGL